MRFFVATTARFAAMQQQRQIKQRGIGCFVEDGAIFERDGFRLGEDAVELADRVKRVHIGRVAVVILVLDEAGQPVQDAIIALVNTSTGQRYESKSRGAGAYNFENVAVGGPYNMEVKAIGYTPSSRTGSGTRHLGGRSSTPPRTPSPRRGHASAAACWRRCRS